MTTILPNERVTEIRARAEKATQGPWDYDEPKPATASFAGDRFTWIRAGIMMIVGTAGRVLIDNAKFIAAARTDIPLLCDSHDAQAALLRLTFEEYEKATNEAGAIGLGPFDGNPLKAWHGLFSWLTERHDAQAKRIGELEADAFTVAHLRSVSDRISEGRGAGANLSDAEVAGRVRMQSPGDLDHEMVCVIGRDRIISLSNEVATLKAKLAEAEKDGERYKEAIDVWQIADSRKQQILSRCESELSVMRKAVENIRPAGSSMNVGVLNRLIDAAIGAASETGKETE